MKISFIFTGKTKFHYVKDGMEEYIRRLKHYLPFEILITQDLKNTRNMNEQEQKNREGELIKKLIPANSLLFLFDERGREYSSEKFADFLHAKMNEGRDICMVVGGAYGFSDELYEMATGKISVSKMTFSHQMIRMIVLEQVYRAFTILRGEPYHHA